WQRPSTGVIADKVKSVTAAGMYETFDFRVPETHSFIANGFLNHNSGKSHTVGTYLMPYYMHRLLKLQRPPQFYGLSRTTMLQGTFAALTYTQAKDTLWTPFHGALTQTSWFNQYHSMLKHYENVYGEKLFKLSDAYVDYRVRSLAAYPMGPDKRVMRGRTRVFACYAANTLVSTNYGLIRIDDPDLVGMQTIRGSSKRKITNWQRTKWATNVVRIKLKNGMELDVTDDHKVLSIKENLKTTRVKARDLVGRFVGVTLGGEFPAELELQYDTGKPADSTSSKYVRLMCELKKFTKAELLEAAEKRKLPELASSNSVMAALASGSALTKESTGCRKPYIFTVVASQDRCLDLVRGTGLQATRKYAFDAPLYMTEELAYIIGCMV